MTADRASYRRQPLESGSYQNGAKELFARQVHALASSHHSQAMTGTASSNSWLSTSSYGVRSLVAVLALGCSSESSTPRPDPSQVVPRESNGNGPSPATPCELDSSLPDRNADALFTADHVPVFDVSLPADAWEALQASAVDEQWEEADVCFDGKQIGSIGLRFKGSYGTLYGCFEGTEQVCPRLSIKLKFSHLDEDLRFFGLKRLNFHANRFDDSRMKEKLAYDLYRAMGIPAPRASWAVIRVNGQSYGLYGMVEELDGRFTADRWPGYPDGNLYKELWPTDTAAADIAAALRTNEDEQDIGGFQGLSQAIQAAADTTEVREALRARTNLELWARYMAVDDAILSYDGVTYFYTDDGSWSHNHNYYFYEDTPGHFTLVPWDVESTFWINPDHAAPHWTAAPEPCNQTYPYWDGLATAPGCDPIFRALSQDLGPWRTAIRELLDGPFSIETMRATIESHQALIGEEARKPATPTTYTSFDNAVANLQSTIPALRARLETLLAEE